MLIVLLQRTPAPVLRALGILEEVAMERAAVILRSSAALGALGAYNSVAGATVFNVTTTGGTSTPASGSANSSFTINATVGTPLTVAITVSGAPGNPKSYTASALPAGVTQFGGSPVNVTAPYKDTISGTPTTAGNTACTLAAWAGTNGTTDTAHITLNFVVTGGSGGTAPAITSQPSSLTVTAGSSATFSVAASGNPAPTYQWKKTGANISGATNASYTIASTVTGDTGSYTVAVTNASGSVTSSAATLTVNAGTSAPTITTQPASTTATVGASASFTVVANGNPAPTYQWLKNGAAISGATNATYTIASTVTGDVATYTVTVTNSVSSVTSSAATLVLYTAPVITSQPTSLTVNAGASATFTVVATGAPVPTYQWYKNGVAISGATNASYTDASALAADAGSYTVVVTNSVSSVTSSAATLTVNSATAPAISTQPSSLTVITGASATFTVVASGNPAPTYQWKKGATNITGATNASYTIAAAASTDAASYTVVVTNTAGSVTSSAATLTVNAALTAPTITTQPTSQTVAPGATVTFTVAATGNPVPTYQWKKGATNVTGATSASFTISNVAPTDAASYTVVVTNSQGTVTSSTAVLTVISSAPVITTQPTDMTVATGAAATFTVAATGNPAPTYQWQKGGVNISGATNSTYVINPTVIGSAGSFAVVITNAGGTVTSTTVTLRVRTLGDFNGDGKADLLLTNWVTGERCIWLMNGSAITAGASLGILSTAWSVEGTGDFNGDGKNDILLTNNVTGERAIWIMNGMAIASGASLGVLPLNWTIDGIGDFDGDGKSDIMLSNHSTGERAVWLMNGASINAGASLGLISTAWSVVGTGDRDNDGKSDVVLTNTVTGARAVWLMNGMVIKGGIYLGTISTDWVINGSGDFDEDGKTDIVLTNVVTGERAVWLMTSPTQTSLGVLSNDWDIDNVGDYDGDGKSDISLTNTVSGARAIWLMNGAAIGAGQYQGILSAAWLIMN
jgi:hypothetical protein